MPSPSTHPALAPGNIAVVTGAASGIGFAAAARFLDMGMRVCIADIAPDALEAAAQSLRERGTVSAQVVDVADRAAVDLLADHVARELGTPSVLMNNAGIGGGGGALENADGWRRVLGVNLLGVLNGVQTFVPVMVAGTAPALVINTGSKQGITQPPGDTAYNVSKAGVKALTEGLAHSLRTSTGDRVSAHLLIPGFTYTGMMARHFTEKPAAAWMPDQVIDALIAGLAARDFYILCADNETTREQDNRRMLWAVGDIVHNRPALSRWHPDHQAAFAAFMADPAP